MRDPKISAKGYNWIQGDLNFTSLGSLQRAI